jgi:hypothetical protein
LHGSIAREPPGVEEVDVLRDAPSAAPVPTARYLQRISTETFTDPADLARINALIHDMWFPLRRIHQDGTDLLVPFASQCVNRAALAMFDSTLRVSNVRQWRVFDTERIEIYDFGSFAFDEASGLLTIAGNIPVRIEVEVDRFAMSVETPGM